MSGLTPTGIHILDADGHVLQGNLKDRKAGRQRARELSSGGSPAYLVDPGFRRRVTPYVDGYQADDPTDAGALDTRVTREWKSSDTDTPAATDTTMSDRPSTGAVEPAGALPELLRPGLDLVIVGINPGAESARAGSYYRSSNNDFWALVSESGVAGGTLKRGDDQVLLNRGIGLTDVVRTRAESDSTKVSRDEIRDAACDFERRIAAAAPRIVCFNGGGKPFDVLFPGARDGWGPQAVQIGDAAAEVWVMPSTSGAARGSHDETRRVLRELAQALGRGATR